MKRANEKRWIVGEHDDERARKIAAALNVSLVIANLLVARGVLDEDDAVRALRPSLEHLYNPCLMRDMDAAVSRILRAIDNDEKVLIYGDYDVDGTTGTVVLRRALQLLGARQTSFHVPHRFTEGYGIRREILEKAKADGVTLVISVDCGIRAHEPLIWAREAGLDCIVTDHHLPDETEDVPPAVAVLNPNRKNCDYPDKNLAGVGVAFKLVHALLRERGYENLVRGFLKMVAIGTVADIAPLVGENRTIVALGLADLPKATNPGLRALMKVAGCDGGKSLRASDLGFRLGPRINAAGRMDAARIVIELFEATDEAEAKRLAEHLDERNRERQIVQSRIVEAAMREMQNEGARDGCVAVIAGEDWHRGVIGLAASKIAERHHLPTIVISLEGETGHGSARSTEAYHLLDGLEACAELFERFGGHARAAGLVIKREHIAELRRRLNDHASRWISEDDCAPSLHIDAELQAEDITLALAHDIARLEPFGAGWERPVFLTKNLRITTEPRALKDKHLKFHVAGEDGRAFETLWWNCLETSESTLESKRATPRCGDSIELAYSIEANSWRDRECVQLIVQDLKQVMSDG
jgi:single-stranded-DNA-specific exonuclease